MRAGEYAGFDAQGRTLIINQETGQPTERNLDRDGIIVVMVFPIIPLV